MLACTRSSAMNSAAATPATSARQQSVRGMPVVAHAQATRRKHAASNACTWSTAGCPAAAAASASQAGQPPHLRMRCEQGGACVGHMRPARGWAD